MSDIPVRASNNFGFLRLLFAALVVFGHSPELIDGNRSRELLTVIFGTLSLGELAVNGFFLISGYLITKSYLQTKSASRYLLKRALRIYPGYLTAYFVCLLIVGPLAGGSLSALSAADVLKHIANAARFGIPYMAGAFSELPYPSLNGSLWTIFYEFGCYIALMFFGLFGILKFRSVFLVMVATLLVTATILHSLQPFQGIAYILFQFIRFLAIFCVGAFFFLYKDRIPYNRNMAIGAVLLLLPLMFTVLAEAATAIFGGYILFWFALTVKTGALSRIGENTDLSYGLYLYAWPVQNLTISLYRDISPYLLSAITIVVAGAIAYLSWTLVERPFLLLKDFTARARERARTP